MFRRMVYLSALCFVILTCSPSSGQTDSPIDSTDEEKIHAELTELLDRIQKSYEARDVDALVENLGPDVVIIWQNASRNHGPNEFRAFYDQMMQGDPPIVTDLISKIEVDGDPILYGDSTAVATGNIKEDYTFADGKAFTLESKWTATFAKSAGQWKTVSYHVSANVLDNPLLTVAKSYLTTFATAGALLGFLLGGLLTWFVMSSSQKLVDKL